jgi:VanZ family protein
VRLLRYWGLAVIWALVITSASTGSFTTERTAGHIIPFLHWLFPHASFDTLEHIHNGIRKGGHVFEYFVFALLVLRGFRCGRAGWLRHWAISTLIVVACFAGLDELHQALVPGRGASTWDALLDTAAGALALLLAWRLARQREKREVTWGSGAH